MKYSKQYFWSDGAASRIESEVTAKRAAGEWPEVPPHPVELLRFMHEDCDFACEHADGEQSFVCWSLCSFDCDLLGSFLDHLQFCYEYGLVNYNDRSAVPLFLHSIMGVGTNLFPMALNQREKLAALVTAGKSKHLEKVMSAGLAWQHAFGYIVENNS
jgi:hypothetical protein